MTITALDIGSSFIRVLIAAYSSDGRFEIKGIGEIPTKGIASGIVKDIQALSGSIRAAVEQAEDMSDLKADNFVANITGTNITDHYGDGRISIPKDDQNKPGEILEEHVEQVISDAKNKSVSILKGFDSLKILHGIPQNYSIDGLDDVINPINMNGFQLNANVYNVFVDNNSLRNLAKAIELAGYHIEPENFVLNHIAIGNAVLSEDEKRMGCFSIDIGGGTCDITLYSKGAIRQVFVVPIAGNDITSDLAIGLKTTPASAEYIKVQYGHANSAEVSADNEIEVEGISGRASQTKSQYLISQIIQRRVEDILAQCYHATISKYKPELITAGIVLTGGTANLKGVQTLVSDAFNMNVKVSSPDLSSITGMISRLEEPSYATAIGLLYQAKELFPDISGSQFSFNKFKSNKFFDKIKNLIKDI